MELDLGPLLGFYTPQFLWLLASLRIRKVSGKVNPQSFGRFLAGYLFCSLVHTLPLLIPFL